MFRFTPIRFLFCALALLVVGCAQAPLLSEVSVEPAAITPDRDGDADVARLRYRIGRAARVRITLVGGDGVTHVLRDARLRQPDVEPYEALFGGVIGERMLPDDDYVIRVVASPVEGGDPAEAEVALSLRGGDASPPALSGFSVQPARFTPNQDGLDDRVTISYRLDEPAEVTLSLHDAKGAWVSDILESAESASEPGEPGPHVYDYDAGVDADAPPPPDGLYTVRAVARDASGNIGRASQPLEIVHGGRPRAALLGDVQWSHKRLVLGETLVFTATVKNVGATPIRTRGPEPGFVYDASSTFNQPAAPSFLLLARASDGRVASLRVPARDGQVELALAPPDGAPRPSPSIESEPVSDGAQAPPERVRLCGRVVDAAEGMPVSDAEVHAFQADGDLGSSTRADQGGGFCFEGLPVGPAHTQNFARSPGALRLGVEHDARRTDVDHPWRWQVGPTTMLEVCHAERESYLCLPPGATVEVSGGLRFDEPTFSTAFQTWLTLMHEDVRRMHGPYQPEQIFLDFDPEAVP